MKAEFAGGKLNGMLFEDVYDVMACLPLKGFTKDLSYLRKQGIRVHRKELDLQPIFEGYLGPMWNGDKLRYEAAELHKPLFKQ